MTTRGDLEPRKELGSGFGFGFGPGSGPGPGWSGFTCKAEDDDTCPAHSLGAERSCTSSARRKEIHLGFSFGGSSGEGEHTSIEHGRNFDSQQRKVQIESLVP